MPFTCLQFFSALQSHHLLFGRINLEVSLLIMVSAILEVLSSSPVTLLVSFYSPYTSTLSCIYVFYVKCLETWTGKAWFILLEKMSVHQGTQTIAVITWSHGASGKGAGLAVAT